MFGAFTVLVLTDRQRQPNNRPTIHNKLPKGQMGKSARSLLLSLTLSANYRYSSSGRDRSIYKLQQSRPHIFPYITTHAHSHRPMPPFPYAYSGANKGKAKTAAIHSLQMSTPPTLISASCVFLPLSFRLTHQAHSRTIYTNKDITIARACRAASPDF